MAVQQDLFGSAPAAPSAAVPPAAPSSPSAASREFATRKIAVWSHRAGELRDGPRSHERAAQGRASGLEQVVARISLEQVGGDALAAARLRLQAFQPRYCERVGANLNGGPIMADLRAQTEALIERLEAERAQAEDLP